MDRHHSLFRRLPWAVAALLFCSLFTTGMSFAQTVDGAQFLRDIEILAADSLQGRLVGTEGSRKAQKYLIGRFTEIGLQPWKGGYEHRFSIEHRDGRQIDDATNLVGVVEGTRGDGRYIVVSAHYDHLGEREGEIYNGADDNASGVAGLLAAAAWFQKNPAPTGLIFAAFDAEEGGLRGARAFVSTLDSLGVNVVMNINMDMISVSEAGELYAAGTYHYPFLKPVLERVSAESPIKLLMGHDSPDLKPGDDWTNSSDHGPFHREKIPFVYFGVEDHPYYHTPEDTFDKVTQEFAKGAALTVLRAINAFAGLDAIGTN